MIMPQLLFGIFLVGCIVGVLLEVLLIIVNRPNVRRHERRVVAIVTQVQVDATTWRSGWRIMAVWSDNQTRQTYTFRSHLLNSRPREHIGDTVFVALNPENPHHYHMEL